MKPIYAPFLEQSLRSGNRRQDDAEITFSSFLSSCRSGYLDSAAETGMRRVTRVPCPGWLAISTFPP